MTVQTWFLQGIDYAEAPRTLEELAARFEPRTLPNSELEPDRKWEPIIRGDRPTVRPGWAPLSELAVMRRGIATGANGFFLLSPGQANMHGIREESLVPCIGKANDVGSLVFSEADLAALRARNGKCLLVNFRGELSAPEMAYVRLGESEGLTSRYILANRTPWYSMERRAVAPIWASVFGRGDLEFVHNAAGASSLTNFHGVYPERTDTDFVKALTAVLNSTLVRAGARLHTRGYGGGLTKFEPNDLKAIPVPDLRAASVGTLRELASLLDAIDRETRAGAISSRSREALDIAVEKAGTEAASSSSAELFQKRPDLTDI